MSVVISLGALIVSAAAFLYEKYGMAAGLRRLGEINELSEKYAQFEQGKSKASSTIETSDEVKEINRAYRKQLDSLQFRLRINVPVLIVTFIGGLILGLWVFSSVAFKWGDGGYGWVALGAILFIPCQLLPPILYSRIAKWWSKSKFNQ